METKDINDAVTMIARGIEILNQGPLNYTLDVLAASHQLLVTKYSPYKVGDRVVLTKEIDFMEAPGWQNHKHFLKVGALATVRNISVYTKSGEAKEDRLAFGISFDDESRIIGNDVIHKPNERVFTFDESYICHERDYKEPLVAPALSKDFKNSETYKLGKMYQEFAYALLNPNTHKSTITGLQEKHGVDNLPNIKWQPIQTAPRDGTRIIVYRGELVEPVTVGYWSFTECRFITPLSRMYSPPTHWMPLPTY